MESEIWLRLCQYWLYGVLGGIVQDVLAGGGLSLPSWDAKARRLKLGVIGSMVLGLCAAVLVDGNIVTALCAAIAGPHVVEELVRKSASVLSKNSKG